MFTNTTRGRRLPRRRAARGLLRARAHGRRRRRPPSRWTWPSCGGRTSSRSSRARYQTTWRVSYDSGDYGAAVRQAARRCFDYKKFRAEQAAAREAGPAARRRLLDVHRGVLASRPPRSSARSAPAPGLYESGKVRVHPTGGVTVFTGSHSHGQGHETTFAQLVADQLGIPMEHGRHRPRRHRRDAVRHGHLRQPLRLGGRHRHPACRSTRSRRRARRSRRICSRPRPATSSSPTASSSSRARRARPSPFGAGRAHRLRAAQLSGGPRARARGDELLRSVELLLPVRRPRLRGRGRPRHRAREDRALHRGGRRRQRDQSR